MVQTERKGVIFWIDGLKEARRIIMRYKFKRISTLQEKM